MNYGRNEGGRFGGDSDGRRGGFRPRRDFGGPREMHKAVCSDCGKECEVPFKPGNDAEGNPRPVYCKDCYQNHRPPRMN